MAKSHISVADPGRRTLGTRASLPLLKLGKKDGCTPCCKFCESSALLGQISGCATASENRHKSINCTHQTLISDVSIINRIFAEFSFFPRCLRNAYIVSFPIGTRCITSQLVHASFPNIFDQKLAPLPQTRQW